MNKNHLKFMLFLYVASLNSMDALKFFYIVRQRQHIVLERLGKFHKVLNPGLNFKIPFVDTPRTVYWSFTAASPDGGSVSYNKSLKRIDTRETVVALPEEQIITQDNVQMAINALIYFRIEDPYKAIYGVDNLPKAVLGVAQTTLRNEIGALTLDATLTSRDKINGNLRKILAKETESWGAEITRVELKEVNPPKDILRAMERQMSAERNRRADIINAEGAKTAAILKAEGEKQSAITSAEGAAQARILEAKSKKEASELEGEGFKNSLSMIASSLPNGDPADFLIAQRYIEMFPEATKNPGTVLLSHDLSAVANLGTTLKSLIKDKK